MAFEWDVAKATSNLRKHGIDFADAVGVFHDPLALSRSDEAVDEERFVAVGADYLGRVLVVAYTLRGNDVRIISARAATRAERRTYEAGLP
jgi:uncharacterized protein